MQDNPYSKMIATLRSDVTTCIPIFYRFGTVISKNPLRVDVAGTIQEKGDLMKSSGVSELSAGDRCLLIPVNEEQQYIILCKVVRV